MRRLVVFGVAGTLAMGTLGVAAASEVAGTADGDEAIAEPVSRPILIDAEAGIITVALPLDGELPDCSAETPSEESVGGPADSADDVSAEETLDDEAVADEPTLFQPGDCVTFELDHPSGKTHHGAIVSSVARALHPSLIDGLSKGEIMRGIARFKHSDDDGDEDEVLVTETEDNDEKVDEASDDAEKDKKPKKEKKNKGKAKGKDKSDG